MTTVNPDIIKWAMEWNSLTPSTLRSSFPKIEKWLSGEKEPTFKELERFAKRTHTIVPFFFANSIPDVRLQIADFRTTTDNNNPVVPSPELFDTIDEMLARQAWLSDYFQMEGYDPLPFVGILNSNRSSTRTSETADYLRSILKLSPDWASQNVSGTDAAVRKLKGAVEKAGVSVAISGFAKGATKRTLNVAEFRGFVLSDKFAPVIFINGRDAKSAQLFTMVHEMVHLLRAQTGVVDYENDTDLESTSLVEGEEKFCNRVAAEFLVPTDRLVEIWEKHFDKQKALEEARRHFKVSYVVCLRRAKEINLLSTDSFWKLYHKYQEEQRRATEEATGTRSSGGDYYATKGASLGSIMTEAIFAAVKRGDLLYSEAYKLTGMKGKTFTKYYQKRGYAL